MKVSAFIVEKSRKKITIDKTPEIAYNKKGMESFRIAIVEDDKAASDTLYEYIDEYGKQNSENFETARFYSAATFLAAFKGNFDVVFMDIELPDRKSVV